MATTARKPRTAKLAAANLFSILNWREDLNAVAADITSAGKRVLDLVLAGRGVVEVDTAKEAIRDAFANAYVQVNGVTFEEACKAKSVQNRISDAMCVFRAPELPASMPSHLQGAAKACRELAAKLKAEAKAANEPVSGEGEGESFANSGAKKPNANANSEDLNPVDQLTDAIASLKAMYANREEAVRLISDLEDVAKDLLEALELATEE